MEENRVIPSVSEEKEREILNGALLTVPASYASLMQQPGVEVKIKVHLSPDSMTRDKDNGKLYAQNIVIEHNSAKSPTTILRTVLDEEIRKRKRPLALLVPGNQPGNSKMGMWLDVNKRFKSDNQNFLLSYIFQFKSNGGLMSDISKFMEHKALKSGQTCEYTLENIQEKIIAGKIKDPRTMLAHFRCLVALYIICRKDEKVQPALLNFLESLKAASGFEKVMQKK